MQTILWKLLPSPSLDQAQWHHLGGVFLFSTSGRHQNNNNPPLVTLPKCCNATCRSVGPVRRNVAAYGTNSQDLVQENQGSSQHISFLVNFVWDLCDHSSSCSLIHTNVRTHTHTHNQTKTRTHKIIKTKVNGVKNKRGEIPKENCRNQNVQKWIGMCSGFNRNREDKETWQVLIQECSDPKVRCESGSLDSGWPCGVSSLPCRR